MSKYSFQVLTFTPSAIADATNLTTGTFMAIQGGTSTQAIDIWSVSLQGQATASNTNLMLLARDSTVGASLTALASPNTNALLPAEATAPTTGPSAFIAATTLPQRSNATTSPKKPFVFNSFGGSAYWHAYDRSECFSIFGNTASLGECSLSGFTGTGTTGPCAGEIIYEVE